MLAPATQFRREDICLSRQAQVPHLDFEFGGEHRHGRHGFPPVGIAAFARVGDRYRHRPRSYAAWVTLRLKFTREDEFAEPATGVLFSGDMAVLVKMGERIR
jgi:hypothetical protein